MEDKKDPHGPAQMRRPGSGRENEQVRVTSQSESTRGDGIENDSNASLGFFGRESLSKKVKFEPRPNQLMRKIRPYKAWETPSGAQGGKGVVGSILKGAPIFIDIKVDNIFRHYFQKFNNNARKKSMMSTLSMFI